MPGKHTVDVLSKCIKSCKNNQACVKGCEDSFLLDGGKVFERDGGKEYTDQTGGKVFIPNPK
jgi:hypothetical protein